MKTLTVRLSDELAAQIEAESRRRKLSKSEIVRERLTLASGPQPQSAAFDAIRDLIGSVDGLPADLSMRKKHYLAATNFGQKRSR